MDIERYKKVVNYIIEKITNKTTEDIPDDISLEYYHFTKNFTNYLGIDQYSDLSDYKEQVFEYITKTFPYSFMTIDNKSLYESIKLYVQSLGKRMAEVPFIGLNFMYTTMQHINKKDVRDSLEQGKMQIIEEPISLNNISGTTVSKYQKYNLYDILSSINDKNINSYIHYLVNNNVFEDEEKFQQVFSGISITQDENGNLYVNEGNHRIFTYIALLKIRDILEIPTKSKDFKVNATIYKSLELFKDKNKKRGK